MSSDGNDGVREINAVRRRVELAAVEGETYGSQLLQLLPSTWRRVMRGDPHYRSYGTLNFLLEAARGKFSSAPTVAREVTTAVLEFVDSVDAPSHVHEIGLRGLAWKEHAHACEAVGDLRAALAAAQRSVEIYGESPALVFDKTRARLVCCMVLREMGEAEKALEIARECALIFEEFGDLTYTNMARMYEAGVLFRAKRFAEALQIFTDVMTKAELEGDRLTVARCLHCGASCAREIGDIQSALDLYPRALALYEELEFHDNVNRVRWGYALTLAADGRVATAISELFKVRAIFLEAGMNSEAASAALDIVRLRFEAGQDVAQLCSDLVTTFVAAGMTQNAIEALAYLRQQAKRGNLTTNKIAQVRTYFGELSSHPALLFVRPPDGEEG